MSGTSTCVALFLFPPAHLIACGPEIFQDFSCILLLLDFGRAITFDHGFPHRGKWTRSIAGPCPPSEAKMGCQHPAAITIPPLLQPSLSLYSSRPWMGHTNSCTPPNCSHRRSPRLVSPRLTPSLRTHPRLRTSLSLVLPPLDSTKKPRLDSSTNNCPAST